MPNVVISESNVLWGLLAREPGAVSSTMLFLFTLPAVTKSYCNCQ